MPQGLPYDRLGLTPTGEPMIYAARTFVLLIALLTLVYFCVYLYWRAGVKERLEEDWIMAGRPGDQDDWIDERLEPRTRAIRRWLVLLVYVVPIVGLSVFIYVTN